MINFLGKYGFIKKKMSISDLSEHFFDSFSTDYSEFKNWFEKKSIQGDESFYFYNNGKIDGFIKLKSESHLETGLCTTELLKLSSFKLGHSCRMFSTQILDDIADYAKQNNYKTIYATCKERHFNLIAKLQRHGYEIVDEINQELILVKKV